MRKIPVTKPYFGEKEIELIGKTLDSGWVAQGPRVAEFEKLAAEHEGVLRGIATTSATTALQLAMIAKGVCAGCDVIAPSFTFVATENSIIASGGTPVMVDVNRDTYNISIDSLKETIKTKYEIKKGVLTNRETGNRLWGIVPVHEFGLCCDIYSVNEIAAEYGLSVIEDAACAMGSKIGEKHQGCFGNVSCVSFHPRKSITTGEGGMIFTDDYDLAERMRGLRTHGATVSADTREKTGGFLLSDYTEAGYNYRMTDIQGALGVAQIARLDYIIEEKRKKASLYNDIIEKEIPEFITPVEPEGYFHTYQSYVCRIDKELIKADNVEKAGNFRNTLLRKLDEKGISTRQGTHAVHMLQYYKKRFGYKPEDYINAYECDRLSIALPLYVQMTDDDQEYVVGMIRKVLNEM